MKKARQVNKIVAAALVSISTVAINIACAIGFGSGRGGSFPVEETKQVSLSASFVEKEIDLNNGIDIAFWETIPPQSIDLFYQSMVLPWPKNVIPHVLVKTFFNGESFYVYLEWKDETEDKTIDINRYSDACAVMFSLDENQQNLSLTMAFQGTSNVWQWKASQDREFWLNERVETTPYVDFHYPFEEEELFTVSKQKISSAANDLIVAGVGTISTKPTQMVEGRGEYDDGSWRVVFKRALISPDPEVDAQFNREKIHLCRFAVWNGSEGDRGGRKSISYWVGLSLN